MAQHNVTLSAVFDDVAKTITLTGSTPPPPRPASVPGHLWFGQSGPGFEVTFNVLPKSVAAPEAEYLKVGADGVTVERWRVQHVDGAWQMPGTLYTEA